LYDGVAARVPEITEARKRLSLAQYLFCYYRLALNTLLGGDTTPIKNGFPETQFSILESKPLATARVGADEDTKTIYVETPQGFIRSVLRFDKLRQEECRHLVVEFEKPGYIEKLKASGLTPAYAILLTPVEIPARTRNWKKSLMELETWFNRIFAYVGIPPSKSDIVPVEQAQKHFDKIPVVERVTVNKEKIQHQFLEEVDPEQNVKVVLIP